MSMLLASRVNSPNGRVRAREVILRGYWGKTTNRGYSTALGRGGDGWTASNGARALRNARISKFARVAELADALASGASIRKDVGVQVPPRAQYASARWMKICANRKGPRETGGLSSFSVANEAADSVPLTPDSPVLVLNGIGECCFTSSPSVPTVETHRSGARGSIVQHPPPVDHLRGPL